MALSFPTYRLSTLFDAAGPFSNLAGGFSLRPLDEVFMTQALLLIPTEMAQRDVETGLRQGLCSLGCWEFSLQALGPIPFTRLEAYTADTRFLSLLLRGLSSTARAGLGARMGAPGRKVKELNQLTHTDSRTHQSSCGCDLVLAYGVAHTTANLFRPSPQGLPEYLPTVRVGA